ncbi:MAG: germination protein YpeB [Clostridiales bacterium]|jgi:spore germination protein|nr:germination protein YpeB [Clostridiales bacterium]
MENSASKAAVREKPPAAAWIIIGLVTAITALALALTAAFVRQRETVGALESMYKKSYYDTADELGNLEVKLSKILVSGSSAQQARLAAEIWKQSGETQINLAQLPIDEQAITRALKFVNQLGDYSGYLNNRIQNGGGLAAEDEENLEMLYERCRQINISLAALSEAMSRDYKFTAHIDRDKLGKGGGALNDSFSGVENNSVDYPKMIYDGPFSDGLDSKVYKLLERLEKRGADEGAAWVKEKLGAETVTFYGPAGGDLLTYEYGAAIPGGAEYYVQLTQNGLKPHMIACGATVNGTRISEEKARLIAEQTASELMDCELKAVWICASDGIAYVNLAPEENGVTYYPDLIKVKIAMDYGGLIGLEANSFLMNHTERTLPAARLSEAEARARVSKKIKIESSRLALIPRPGDKEALAYEFSGTHRGHRYIVCVCALTGEELDIMRVVETAGRGSMLE